MERLTSLNESELFTGLSETECAQLSKLARDRTIRAGETLFQLGSEADTIYVIASGQVELRFPLRIMGEVKEISFQSLTPGRALAWSGLVSPHRFTMSARGVKDGELTGFARADLLRLFAEQPRIGFSVMSNLSHIIAIRHHEMQALWVREVQRNVSETYR